MSGLSDLPEDQRRFLLEAAEYLENPRFLMKAANLVGRPAEGLLGRLPQKAQHVVARSTESALQRAMTYAVRSLDPGALPIDPIARLRIPPAISRRIGQHMHTAMAATTGAVGGFFGFAGLPLELPATTVVMLRSIAGIAAEQGFDLEDPLVRLNCLAVFSLGSEKLQAMESAYLTSRLGLALALAEAAKFVARHSSREIADSLARGTAPVLLRLINLIASRFQVTLSQKITAQAVPVAGAAMGALINAAFTDHFNRVARYHFQMLQMERRFGKDLVLAAYAEAVREMRRGQSQARAGD